MIKQEAYLVDGHLVVLDRTWLANILHDCRKIKVEMGTFVGYVNYRGAPIGQFYHEDGAVYDIYEDSTELISA